MSIRSRARLEPQPLRARACENDPVPRIRRQLAQTRRHVAAQIDDLQIRAQPAELMLRRTLPVAIVALWRQMHEALPRCFVISTSSTARTRQRGANLQARPWRRSADLSRYELRRRSADRSSARSISPVKSPFRPASRSTGSAGCRLFSSPRVVMISTATSRCGRCFAQRVLHHRRLRAREIAAARAEHKPCTQFMIVARRGGVTIPTCGAARAESASADREGPPRRRSQSPKSATCSAMICSPAAICCAPHARAIARRSIAANRCRKGRRRPSHSRRARHRAAPRYR